MAVYHGTMCCPVPAGAVPGQGCSKIVLVSLDRWSAHGFVGLWPRAAAAPTPLAADAKGGTPATTPPWSQGVTGQNP